MEFAMSNKKFTKSVKIMESNSVISELSFDDKDEFTYYLFDLYKSNPGFKISEETRDGILYISYAYDMEYLRYCKQNNIEPCFCC
jgi:hypothetical protein